MHAILNRGNVYAVSMRVWVCEFMVCVNWREVGRRRNARSETPLCPCKDEIQDLDHSNDNVI